MQEVNGPYRVLMLNHTPYESAYKVGSFQLCRQFEQRLDVEEITSVAPIRNALSLRRRSIKRESEKHLSLVGVGLIPLKFGGSLPLLAASGVTRILLTILRRGQFTHVIFDNPYYWRLAQFCRTRGARTIFRLTDWYPDMIQQACRGEMERHMHECFETADLVIATSSALHTRAAKRGSNCVHTLENGVDLEHFVNSPRPENPARAGLRAIYYGAIDHRFDLPALREVASRNPDVTFDIYSADAPAATALQNNVHFHPPLAYDELPSVLNTYDLAFLSFSDTPANAGRFPMKLCEFLASGVVVVVPPLEALAELENVQGVFKSAEFGPAGLHLALRKAADLLLRGQPKDLEALRLRMREVAEARSWKAIADSTLTIV